MANGGWYGTKEEWERSEALLLQLDPTIDAFATRHDLTVSHNGRDWPERSIRWGDHISCLIQIWLVSAESMKLNVWICATQDRENKRFWKREFLLENANPETVREALPTMLGEGLRKVSLWASQPDTLEFATELATPPKSEP